MRGTCPKCGRSFARLSQHMRRQHPPMEVTMKIAEVEITRNGKRVGYLKHVEWDGTGTPPNLAQLLAPKGGR